MEFSPDQIITGLIGIGIVVKGVLDHLARVRKVDPPTVKCESCHFDPLAFAKLDLHMDRQDQKHDVIIDKLSIIERKCADG